MTILLAHVPNESAEAAFAEALEQAVTRQLPLVIVNAVRGQALVEKHAATAEHLEELMVRALERGVQTTIEQPVASDVVEAVLEAAKDNSAALIVVGIRHRSSVGKLIMGSDAQRILLDADCPVLAVKALA